MLPMDNKSQRKRGKNKNQIDNSLYHTQSDNNNGNNSVYRVLMDNPSYSTPPRSSRNNRYNSNRYNNNNNNNPNENNSINPNIPHINATNHSNNINHPNPNANHPNHPNHHHRQYNRDNSSYHRYYRPNRYPSHSPHNQTKYQYNSQKPRGPGPFPPYYPNNNNQNSNSNGCNHNNANSRNNSNHNNHHMNGKKYKYNHTHTHHAHNIHGHGHGHSHSHPHNNRRSDDRMLHVTSCLMASSDASPDDEVSDDQIDNKIKDNDGSHKYHRFTDQQYHLNKSQITKLVQIFGQKHEIHDKLKTKDRNRDFSTILARFLLSLLCRLEACGVDGLIIGPILLGGGAAAYVLDEHSEPKLVYNNINVNVNKDNNINGIDKNVAADMNNNNKQSYPPLHYNDVDIMLEIEFEDWDDLVLKWQQNDKSLAYRNEKEHHIAVYAAIRTAFLESLREFAPKDMQNMDIEDICSSYLDTQKRFVCGDEDSNGGNSDCWAIYSGNHDRGHYLDLVFIHKMKRRYTFPTDSFRIKISKTALEVISESIRKHERKYKAQQFEKRHRSNSYPSLSHLKEKRNGLDQQRRDNKEKGNSTEIAHPDLEPSPQPNPQPQPQAAPPGITGHLVYHTFGRQYMNGAPPLLHTLHPRHPFYSYRLPPKQIHMPQIHRELNWSTLADTLCARTLRFNAYALCGDFEKARENLCKRNIGKVHNPEKIHGGGFFKYCDLISKQWQRSEKLEKFLWIRLSWDIDINHQSMNSNGSEDMNKHNNRYHYMNDLKDIDRTLATYIRRHYKNRPLHATKFLNCLENVIKDLRQDDAALEVLSHHIHRLRAKLDRHLHEQNKHLLEQNQSHSVHKSPPMIHHHPHAHPIHHPHAHMPPHIHPAPPPPLHPAAPFPPLPNGAPIMTPNGVLMNQHFAHILHHGKQLQSIQRSMFPNQPAPPPPPQPPHTTHTHTAQIPPPPPPHRQPLIFPAPAPLAYLRNNNNNNNANGSSSNNNNNNNNNSGGGNTLQQMHHEFQQRYNSNEWVHLYNGHNAPAPVARKAYHIVPNSLVNLNLSNPSNATAGKSAEMNRNKNLTIGNIIQSYIPNNNLMTAATATGNDSLNDEKEELMLKIDIPTPPLQELQLMDEQSQSQSARPKELKTKRRQRVEEEKQEFPSTPSSIDSAELNEINIDINLDLADNTNTQSVVGDQQNVPNTTITDEGVTTNCSVSSVLPSSEGIITNANANSNANANANAKPVILTNPIYNQLVTGTGIASGGNPATVTSYQGRRFFQVNGQTYQFPVNYFKFVLVPQQQQQQQQHTQRRVFVPPPQHNTNNIVQYVVNNNDDNKNAHNQNSNLNNPNNENMNSSVSPPPPHSGCSQSFNKGVVYQQQIENNLQSIHFQAPSPPQQQTQTTHKKQQTQTHIIPHQYHHVSQPQPQPQPHQSPFILHPHLISQQAPLTNTDNPNDTLTPPQKNNSERFRRPENMNDNNQNNANDIAMKSNSNNNKNKTSPPNQSHTNTNTNTTNTTNTNNNNNFYPNNMNPQYRQRNTNNTNTNNNNHRLNNTNNNNNNNNIHYNKHINYN